MGGLNFRGVGSERGQSTASVYTVSNVNLACTYISWLKIKNTVPCTNHRHGAFAFLYLVNTDQTRRDSLPAFEGVKIVVDPRRSILVIICGEFYSYADCVVRETVRTDCTWYFLYFLQCTYSRVLHLSCVLLLSLRLSLMLGVFEHIYFSTTASTLTSVYLKWMCVLKWNRLRLPLIKADFFVLTFCNPREEKFCMTLEIRIVIRFSAIFCQQRLLNHAKRSRTAWKRMTLECTGCWSFYVYESLAAEIWRKYEECMLQR